MIHAPSHKSFLLRDPTLSKTTSRSLGMLRTTACYPISQWKRIQGPRIRVATCNWKEPPRVALDLQNKNPPPVPQHPPYPSHREK
jgi:hypothetical protein